MKIKSTIFLFLICITFSSQGQTDISLIKLYGGRVSFCKKNNVLAFDRQNLNGYYNVYLTDTSGNGLVNITDKLAAPQKHNGNPTWHPNGKWIVFQSQIDTVANIFDVVGAPGLGVFNNLWVTDSVGNQFWQLTNYPSSLPAQGVLHPHFSSDGTKVIWAHLINNSLGPHGHWEILIADFVVDSMGVPSLQNIQIEHPGLFQYVLYETHGFSPGGDTIYFSSPMNNSSFFDWDEYSYDLNTQTLTNLTNSPEVWDEFAKISPDGSKIVWASSQGYPITSLSLDSLKLDWWIMNIDGSNKQQITFYNTMGYPEYSTSRRGCADISWGTNSNNFYGLVQSDDAGLGSVVRVKLDTTLTLRIDRTSLSNQILIYPNPTKNIFFIKSEDWLINGSISIIDMNGKLIKEISKLTGLEFQVSTFNIPKGKYLIKIGDEISGFRTSKIIFY